MIDYQELKRLAEAVESADHYISRSLAVTALANAANPATVLALIAEFEASGLYWMAERDKLRAEVEALRKDAERYRFLRSDTSRGKVDFCIKRKHWGDNDLSRIISLEQADSEIDAAMQQETK